MDEAWADPDFQPFSFTPEHSAFDPDDVIEDETDWDFDPSDVDLNALIPLWDERDKTVIPF